MSNRICIEPCKFVNVRNTNTTLGVRVYDNYSKAYENTWNNIPDDDLDILSKVLESDDDIIKEMMDFIAEDKESVDIGGNSYAYDEYKHLLD